MHTDQPKKPRNGAGSKVHCLESMKTMVVLNWSPPENYDRTIIDYYELTLIGKDTKPNTTRVYVGAQADPRQSLSHILQVDLDRDYTSANISAVDVCGQQSEPSLFAITPAMTDSTSTTPNSNGTTQAGYLGIGVTVLIIIIFTLLELYKISH